MIRLAVANLVLSMCTFSLSFAQESHTESIMQSAGISPNQESISDYIATLQPSAELVKRAEGLLSQLGSANYEKRESALKELRGMPRVPKEALAIAQNHHDPEIRWRANQISELQTHNRRLIWAILVTVREKKLTGLVPEVISTMRLLQEDDQVQRLGRRAVVETVLTTDEQIIRELLQDSLVPIRITATESLVKVLGDEAAAELANQLKDPDDGVRFAAAIGLATTRNHQSLHALIGLLSSPDLSVRTNSLKALRDLTGKTCGYLPYGSRELRERSIEKWNSWLAGGGADFEFDHVDLSPAPYHVGNTLICEYRSGVVLDVDPDGRVLKRLEGYSGPWGARRLQSGHILVNWYDSSCVVEYDVEGREIWKFDCPSASWSAEPTGDDNVLVAYGQTVVEIARSGEQVWSQEFSGTPSHAIRLENGNTLVAIMNGGNSYVSEIAPDGTVVAKIERLNYPYRVQRLSNGNTLVVERSANRVLEYDAAMDQVIWSSDVELNAPDSAQRLPNGNTLISDATQIIEISPANQIISQRPFTQGIVWQY